jgi:hypothetical protein
MIPAPLRAPPTGVTDAGYKAWQGAFVLADSKHRTLNVQRRRFDTVLPIQRRRDMLVKKP